VSSGDDKKINIWSALALKKQLEENKELLETKNFVPRATF